MAKHNKLSTLRYVDTGMLKINQHTLKVRTFLPKMNWQVWTKDWNINIKRLDLDSITQNTLTHEKQSSKLDYKIININKSCDFNESFAKGWF